MRLARELAERIVALRFDSLSRSAVDASRTAILDTIGVTLAGSSEAAPRLVEDVLGLQDTQGPSLIFGTRRRATALDAALINGTAAHVLDFDNTASNLGGQAIPYTGPLFDPEDPFDAEVRVTLTDGRVLDAKVDRPLGRTADNPIPFEHLQAKFENCARLVVSAEAASAASRLIAGLETLASVQELTALLEPAARSDAVSKVHAQGRG